MIIFDWICLIIIVLFAFFGFFNGLLKEIRVKAGMIIGLILAAMFTGRLTGLLAEPIAKYRLGIFGPIIIAVVVIFVGYMFSRFLVKIIEHIFEAGNMRSVDRMLGFVIGALEGVAVSIMLIFLMRLQNVIPIVDIFSGSIVIDQLSPFILWILKFDFPGFASQFKVGI